jgi:DNA-binding NarL/FixJ family response regulator
VTGAVLTFRDISARPQAELVLAEACDTLVKLLTPRENEVLQLMVDGFSTKEIASDFNISPRTVESHRQNMMRKFGLPTCPCSSALPSATTSWRFLSETPWRDRLNL